MCVFNKRVQPYFQTERFVKVNLRLCEDCFIFIKKRYALDGFQFDRDLLVNASCS